MREVESAGNEVGLVGFSVLSDNLETVPQLVLDAKRCIARGGSLSTLRRFAQAMMTRGKQAHVQISHYNVHTAVMYIRHFTKADWASFSKLPNLKRPENWVIKKKNHIHTIQ